jgi:Clostripain family.
MPPEFQPGGASDDRKWTVMVFMGADTIAGNAPLIDSAEADLAEMRSVGSGSKLNIFVQVHRGQNTVPRRGQITSGMLPGIEALEPVSPDEADPARGRALESFILDALTKADYRAGAQNHHVMLVLWGHAYDFAIGREHTRGGTIDALDFAELSGVLENLQRRFGATGAKLDILGFDACDLATVEMAYQLQPFAKYLLGSQIGIPLPGWPYDRVLDRLRTPYGSVMGPAELGSYIVRRFCESYSAQSRTVSLTLLDLNRAQDLADVTQVLALTLATAISNPDARDQIAYLFSQSRTAPGRPYVDVADLCLNLVRSSGNTFVIEAARTLGDFLLSPQPVVVGESETGAGRPFIVEHGRNTGLTARLNGLSIYAPHVVPGRDFNAVRHLYENFTFAQETQWNGLVHALARRA